VSIPNRSSLAAAAYRDLLQEFDAWFARSSNSHPGVVPSRAGCARCYHGPFDISVADVVLVREAVRQLPIADQETVVRRAQDQAATMRGLSPDLALREGIEGLAEQELDRLVEAMADTPCPLLDESGACRIYPDRPLVCRIMGLGIVTPAGRVLENACPIAGQFPAYAELPPQPLDLESLEELELACLEAASVELFGTPQRSGFETTIALALVTSDE
jgi:Putative zinc- or iron-chelating domain